MHRAVLVLVSLVSGCGSRCQDVQEARAALTSRAGTPDRGADVQVVMPFAKANVLLAELLAQQPVTVSIDAPAIGPLDARPLTATVLDATLLAGSPGTVRFAVRLRIDDPGAEVTTIAATAEVAPELVRASGETALVIGIGPENILALRPSLSPEAAGKLGGAVTRWLPSRLAGKVPQAVIDQAAKKLGGHLTGAAWSVLQKTLLARLGEVTRLRLRLPDVPLAKVSTRSTPAALLVDLASELPIRAGLVGDASPSDEITVRIAGSAAAELGNWALDQGLLPTWYTRSLRPSPTGEFQPRFDYAPRTDHPFQIYALQQRGSCSYFQVGVAATLGVVGDQLEVRATDRELVAQSAHPLVEIAAWTKLFLFGAFDQAKRVAAHTQFVVGGRALATSVVSATYARDELAFALRITPR